METIGSRRWAIAEDYIPPSSTGDSHALTSHETACILNAGDQAALVTIIIFLAGGGPAHAPGYPAGSDGAAHDDRIRGAMSIWRKP